MSAQPNRTTAPLSQTDDGPNQSSQLPTGAGTDQLGHNYARMEGGPRTSFQVEQLAGRQSWTNDGATFGISSSSLNTGGQRRSSVIGNYRSSTMSGDKLESTRGDAADGYAISDQTAKVDNFFSSIRTPAAFLAGASFSQMFSSDDEHGNSIIQTRLQTACLVCQGFTFVLSMNVIVLSSSALVRILTANFDPFAENAYEMLFREFHYEFVSVRWSFNVSMYGFLIAVTLKILYEFELFNVNADDYVRDHLELGIAVVLLMVAFYLHLTAYVNQTLIGWSNQYTMTGDLLKILVQRGKHSVREPLSLLLAGLGVVFLIMAFIPGAQI
jgi:hypothetical protein